MATQTLATADAILKDMYVGPIVEQINQKTYLLDQIEREGVTMSLTGRRAIIPVHTNRNRGRGARGDGGTLPTAGKQSWQDAIIHIKYNFSSIEVTDAAIRASQTNEGAFVDVLDAESKGVATDLRKEMNRIAFGEAAGLTGVRAEATSTKVIPVNSVQYVYVGDTVDIVKKADGTVGEGKAGVEVIKREGGSTKQIEVSESVTKVTTAYAVYVAGNYGNEFDGLRNIIASGRTLHEINSSTTGNEFWNSRVQSVGESESALAVAGEPAFEKLADEVGLSGNGDVEVFLTSRGVRRNLANTYASQKRYSNAEAVNVHGGYSAIMVNEIPVIADDDCPRTFAFGINKDSFRWFEQSPPGWMEQGGGGIFHLKDGTTAGSKVATWQAFFSWYAALGCIAPNRNGKLQYCEDDVPTGEGEV
ncbi:MAG: phage major capsid protein [Actinobacteria bacterium]|nr:phage major capsid protein [Actinomycetota bacterium]